MHRMVHCHGIVPPRNRKHRKLYSIPFQVFIRMKSSGKDLTKEDVLELRKEHYCSSVSVSYSNSDPLMIVEVRLSIYTIVSFS